MRQDGLLLAAPVRPKFFGGTRHRPDQRQQFDHLRAIWPGDTADVYSNGESEEVVGKAIASRRDDIVLATKVHMPMGDDANSWEANSRKTADD